MKSLSKSLSKSVLNQAAFLGFTVIAAGAAHAQSSGDLTCRAKAKEVATTAYSSCVTESRNTQIDQIRKDYQRQLADLKSKYDKELKKVGVKTSANSSGNSAAPSAPQNAPSNGQTNASGGRTPLATSSGSAPRATKGIAKTLPTRKEVRAQTPAPQESDERAVNPDSTAPSSSEDSASQNDAQNDLKIQLVPSAEARDKTAASSEGSSY